MENDTLKFHILILKRPIFKGFRGVSVKNNMVILREKLCALLTPIYPMKMIIQMTKSCTDKATQKAVKDVIHLIEDNDYVLV